jgi:competence protein ComEC
MAPRRKRPPSESPRAAPPLLPWQPCLPAYAAGILAVAFPLPALCGLLLLALFPRPAPGRPRLRALCLAFALGCAAGFFAMPAAPTDVPACVAGRKPCAVAGRVAAVEGRPGGRLGVVLEDVRVGQGAAEEASLPGKLLLTIDRPAFCPVSGARLGVTARVRTTAGFDNPGGPDFAFIRRLDGIFWRAYARGDKGQVVLTDAGDDVLALRHEVLRQAVSDRLAAPEGADASTRAGRAMTLALVFGDVSGFAQADLDLLRRASLSHTLALSGMNVAYVVAMGAALTWGLGRLRPGIFLWLPRPSLTLLLAAPLVVGYCWLGGYSPSLYRAAFMFGCGALLVFAGRQAPVLDGLFLALALMLAAMPLAAFDARLQLSVLAVVGIVAFWPPFAAASHRVRLPGLLRWPLLGLAGVLWTSLCAEVAVMPLIARLFGDLNSNPWINVLWLPPLGLVVTPLALVGTALLAVPFAAPLGAKALLLAAWCCEGLMRGLAFLDARHCLLTSAILRPTWPETLGCLGLLAGLAVVLAGGRRATAAMAASLCLLVGPTLVRGVAALDGAVRLTVLDVGQGQSVVLELPGGRRFVVDAGGLYGDFDVGRHVVGAFLTDGRPPRIDAAFASHPHADHVKGFVSLLARFDVGAFFDNGGTPEGALAAPIAAALDARRIPHAALAAGDAIDLGDGLALAVLHPGPDDDRSGNNGSLVLRLTRNGRGLAVVPGDAERGVLSRLAASGTPLSADVLVLPHHGSATGLSRRFLAAVSPRAAIASCGDIWPFPAPKLEALLEKGGCRVYATRRDGAVTVTFPAGAAPPVVQTRRASGEEDVQTPFAMEAGTR